MKKKRVFISYSTLTERPNIADGDVENTRECLTQRLGAAGYEPLVDRRLRSGEPWRHQIYRWIALCDAAVVLLSRSALRAPWVRKEVELLMWRWELEGRRSPLILPFRLGDVQPAEIPKEEFSATFITELQAPVLKDAALADAVVSQLALLPAESMARFPLSQIESAIAAKLIGLSSTDLDDALQMLKVESDVFEPSVPDPIARKRAVLAAALLDTDLKRIRKFLEQKAPSLPQGAAEFLVDWVATFRVDENHASAVYRSSRVKPHEIAITSQSPRFARHYVARGYLLPKPPRVLTPVLRIDESVNDEAAVEAIVEQLAQKLLDDFGLGTRAQLRAYLKKSEVPRFIALRMVWDHPELRQRLQDEFENVTFLFFTRNEAGLTVELSQIGTLTVSAQNEDDFIIDYLDAMEVAKS